MFRKTIFTPDHRVNTNLSLVVDQFDSKEFNKNDAGWSRNDISQLARATSQSQYDAIMRRLVELKNEGNIPKGTTIEDAITMVKPRFAQSPNEIEQWIQFTNPSVMKKLDLAYQRTVEEPKSTTQDPPASSEPAK